MAMTPISSREPEEPVPDRGLKGVISGSTKSLEAENLEVRRAAAMKRIGGIAANPTKPDDAER
jgi:hypothetical protein